MGSGKQGEEKLFPFLEICSSLDANNVQEHCSADIMLIKAGRFAFKTSCTR